MKLKSISAMAFSAMLLMACGEAETKQTEDTSMETMESVNYNVDATASMVNWRGEVAGVYGHEGFVKIKKGQVTAEGNTITGGEIVVDMTGIYPTDSASFKDQDGGRITDLQGHLAADDFFATEKFPISTFVITGVEGNTVTGDLTIRDKTSKETINITSMEVTDGGLTATGELVFDRQKYDVAWVHYMKDMVLSDNIKLTFTFVAKRG